jgi:hypothetical protein
VTERLTGREELRRERRRDLDRRKMHRRIASSTLDPTFNSSAFEVVYAGEEERLPSGVRSDGRVDGGLGEDGSELLHVDRSTSCFFSGRTEGGVRIGGVAARRKGASEGCEDVVALLRRGNGERGRDARRKSTGKLRLKL